MQLALFFFATLLLVSRARVAPQETQEAFVGDGTSYTLDKISGGNCALMKWPAFAATNYVAMNNDQWNNMKVCGRCVDAWCVDPRCTSAAHQVLYVVDRCPECKYGALDMGPVPYKKITGHDPHRLKIQWRFVPCPLQGPMDICLKSGSNAWWAAVQTTNAAAPVESVAVNGMKATPLDSAFFFSVSSGQGLDLSKLHVSVTSIHGETLDQQVSLQQGTCVSTNMQFKSPQGSDGIPMAWSSASSPPLTPPSIMSAPIVSANGSSIWSTEQTQETHP